VKPIIALGYFRILELVLIHHRGKSVWLDLNTKVSTTLRRDQRGLTRWQVERPHREFMYPELHCISLHVFLLGSEKKILSVTSKLRTFIILQLSCFSLHFPKLFIPPLLSITNSHKQHEFRFLSTQFHSISPPVFSPTSTIEESSNTTLRPEALETQFTDSDAISQNNN
jgi:hypothetical protein